MCSLDLFDTTQCIFLVLSAAYLEIPIPYVPAFFAVKTLPSHCASPGCMAKTLPLCVLLPVCLSKPSPFRSSGCWRTGSFRPALHLPHIAEEWRAECGEPPADLNLANPEHGRRQPGWVCTAAGLRAGLPGWLGEVMVGLVRSGHWRSSGLARQRQRSS